MITATTSTRIDQGMIGYIERIISINPIEVLNDDGLTQQLIQIIENSTHDGGARIVQSNRLSLPEYVRANYVSRNYTSISTLDNMNRVALVPQPAIEVQTHLEAVQRLKDTTGLSKGKIGELIGVTRQTIDDWKKKGTIISDVNRRRLFAVQEVIERAATKHKSKELLVAWLDTPRGSDGRTPAQLLAANEINKARLLAMSSPSSRLAPVPKWVNRPVARKFQLGAERRQEILPPDPDKALDSLIDNEN